MEELRAETEKRLREGLEEIPDEIIYSMEDRPFGYFLCMLSLIYAFLTLLAKLLV